MSTGEAPAAPADESVSEENEESQAPEAQSDSSDNSPFEVWAVKIHQVHLKDEGRRGAMLIMVNSSPIDVTPSFVEQEDPQPGLYYIEAKSKDENGKTVVEKMCAPEVLV